MNDGTTKLLKRAEYCLEEATQLFVAGYLLGSINRSYYSIFCCARALLNEAGFYAKTHQGVLNKFGELYVKTSLMQKEHGNSMRVVFEMRQISDYDYDAEFGDDDAKFAIDSAASFLSAAKQLLNPNNT